MRNFDPSSLYRSSVGFDRIFDLLDNVSKIETTGYPPYNIERVSDDDYRITVAVAGFAENDIEIESRENVLTVKGARGDDGEPRQFLHQGIAGRSFERRFQLAEHVRVNGASLENGLLNIELAREIPEAMKPRKIAITNADNSNLHVVDEQNAA